MIFIFARLETGNRNDLGKYRNRGGIAVAQIMTTNEIAEYLKLHPITVTKYARESIIPATRIGGIWRFDKELIDQWIALAHNNSERDKDIQRRVAKKSSR